MRWRPLHHKFERISLKPWPPMSFESLQSSVLVPSDCGIQSKAVASGFHAASASSYSIASPSANEIFESMLNTIGLCRPILGDLRPSKTQCCRKRCMTPAKRFSWYTSKDPKLNQAKALDHLKRIWQVLPIKLLRWKVEPPEVAGNLQYARPDGVRRSMVSNNGLATVLVLHRTGSAIWAQKFVFITSKFASFVSCSNQVGHWQYISKSSSHLLLVIFARRNA